MKSKTYEEYILNRLSDSEELAQKYKLSIESQNKTIYDLKQNLEYDNIIITKLKAELNYIANTVNIIINRLSKERIPLLDKELNKLCAILDTYKTTSGDK